MIYLGEQNLNDLKRTVAEVEKEKGKFSFFGVFRAEETPEKWDIVASAEWVAEGNLKATRYLVEKFREYAPGMIEKTSRLVLNESNSFLPEGIPVLSNGKDAKRVERLTIGEVDIIEGYVFRNVQAGFIEKVASA